MRASWLAERLIPGDEEGQLESFEPTRNVIIDALGDPTMILDADFFEFVLL